MLKYEGVDYDLNCLLQFEMLKKLIEAIAKNQLQMNERMNGFIENASSNNANEIDENEPQAEENEAGDHTVANPGLMKRIATIERRLNDVKTLEKQVKTSLSKADKLNDDLNCITDKVKKHDVDIINDKNDIKELKENLEEMKNKMNDYNMYEMFKDTSEEGGQLDTTKAVIMNLETKVFKKFNLIDERNKKAEEESMKAKTELINLKNKTDVITQQFSQIQEDFQNKCDNLANETDKKSNELSTVLNQHKEEMDLKLKQLEDFNVGITNTLKETEESLLKAINESKPKEVEVSGFPKETGKKSNQDKELRLIKELNIKVMELESSTKAIKASLIIDQLQEEIDKLQEEMRKRPVKNDFVDINDKILSIETVISSIKDIDDVQNSSLKSQANEISSISKKLENLTGVIISMQEGGGGYSSGRPMIDMSKYVDMTLFNNEIKSIRAILTDLGSDSSEYRRKLNDLMPLLITAAKINDLKALEKQLVSSIEESNLSNVKKYADRSEMFKRMKLIDTQLKHTLSEVMKKNDKSEHWMIASKPVAGFKCVSCESEIEDLNSHNREYLPWKKYPLKIFPDKSYRLGNGFSRMLQKMNLDMAKVNEYGMVDLSESDNDDKKKRNSSEEKSKKPSPPKVKTNQIAVDDFKTSYMYTENPEMKGNKLHSQEKKEREPKVVKIYKKIKLVNDDINSLNKNDNEIEAIRNSND